MRERWEMYNKCKKPSEPKWTVADSYIMKSEGIKLGPKKERIQFDIYFIHILINKLRDDLAGSSKMGKKALSKDEQNSIQTTIKMLEELKQIAYVPQEVLADNNKNCSNNLLLLYSFSSLSLLNTEPLKKLSSVFRIM